MCSTPLPARFRNIGIFIFGVLVMSGFGAFLIRQGTEIGGLLFVLSPTIMAFGLRSLGGDGWKDSGFAFNLRGNSWDYLGLILLFPVAYFIVGLLGHLTGTIRFAPGFAGRFVTTAGAQAIPLFLYALAEEIGWRGYLYPKLCAVGISALFRDLIIAVVWAMWHIPYFIVFPMFHGLPVWQFAGLFVLSLYATTMIYGHVQKRTRSIWPMVLAHAMLGVLSTFFADPEIVVVSQQSFLALRPESIAVILIQLLFLVWVRARR